MIKSITRDNAKCIGEEGDAAIVRNISIKGCMSTEEQKQSKEISDALNSGSEID